MLFDFLKYLQPTHYFLLANKKGEYVYPDISQMSSEILSQLERDDGYDSPLAGDYDLTWQTVMLGYMGEVTKLRSIEKLPVKDNYRFVARYFAKPWLIHILFLRLIGFNNPLKEMAGCIRAFGVQRRKMNVPINQPGKMDSLKKDDKVQPLVSVVIPTLNRYSYLKEGLHDLERQDHKNLEVLVVDQSTPFNPSFFDQFNLDLKVIHQEERALWLARNTAIKQTTGDYILLFDDDSRVEPNWVSSHLKTLNYFDADISSGVSISTVGDNVPNHYSYYRISDQLDTGNAMICKKVFENIGLFDRQFEKQRMGDGEFGLRAYLQGYKNISNPEAKRLHLKVNSGGLREMGSWDAFRTKGWLSPRPIPSVLYLYRRYFGNVQARYALLKGVPPSMIPYRLKRHKVLLLIGALWSVLLSPLILWQVYKSWRLASKKMAQGPLIEYLDA